MVELEYVKVRPGGVDVDAARAVANDVDAPRRSLTLPRTSMPGMYAGRFVPPYPGLNEDTSEWESRWYEHVRAAAPHEEIGELEVDVRLEVYDGADGELRGWWERTWRSEANSWVDATADLFADDRTGSGGAGSIDRIETVDGGLLLFYAHNEELEGTAMWMEAVRFGYGEVAAAAGVTFPEIWDVR